MMPGERGPTEKVSASGQASCTWFKMYTGGGEAVRLSDISLS